MIHQRFLRVKDAGITKIWFLCALFSVVAIFFILGFLLYDAAPAFIEIGLLAILTGMRWDPTAFIPMYGAFPLIIGTLLVTVGSMVIAIPLGIGSAVYISELASPRLKNILKPAVELLAGVPSVVYGFFGLVVLVQWIQVSFDVVSGETVIAGSILLGIMALPTIISVSEDAISSVPRFYKEGSLALGATHWQTISRILVPSALSGITAAIILGIGRAVGETMAVMMVTGNAAVIPDPIWNILSPVRTLTGTLGIEMGEVAIGSLHYHALFAVAVILLAITLLINITATIILARIKEKQMGAGSARKRGSMHVVLNSSIERIRPYLWLIPVLLFIVFCYAVFGWVGLFYSSVLLLLYFNSIRILSPQWIQRIVFSLLLLVMVTVIGILGVILYDIFSNGLPYVTIPFLTEYPVSLGRGGGIYPAIIGTIYLVAGAILIALALGVGSAIYLTEYTKENALSRLIRTATDLLNGTPSIVFGLFGFTFLVLYLNWGVCMLAGQVTLALMILPTLIRTTEEALRSVPSALREGSLALGATKWQTIYRVVLPLSVPGIITGSILSIGRAAGETAPIMFTAVVFSRRYLPDSVFDPVMALPYHLFVLATNVPGATHNQYATAVVLLLLVILIYAVAIVIRNRFTSTIRW